MSIQQTVDINQDMISHVTELYRSDPVVTGAVQRLLSQIVRGGIDIKGIGRNKTAYLNTSNVQMQQFIEGELLPQVRRVILNFILYGFTAVQVVHSQNFMDANGVGWPTIAVIDHENTRYAMNWNAQNQRIYTVYKSGASGRGVDGIVPLSRVFCLNEPDVSGRLQNPLALCAKSLAVASQLRTYYLGAAHKLYNPALIFSREDSVKQIIGSAGLESQSLSSQIVSGSSLGVLGTVDDIVQRTQAAESVDRAHIESFTKAVTDPKFNNGASGRGQMPSLNPHVPKEIVAIEKMPEFTRPPLFAPPGSKLEKQIQPQVPAGINEMIQNIHNDFLRAMGLLPFNNYARSNSTGNDELIRSTLRDTVHSFQTSVKPLLSSILAMILAPKLIDELNSDMLYERNRLAAEQRIDELALLRPTLESTEYANSVFSSNNEYLSPNGTIFQDTDDVRIEVEFFFNPIMSYDEIEKIYKIGIIHEEGFQKIVALMCEIPDEFLRPDMEKWVKEQQKNNQPNLKSQNNNSSSSSSSKKKEKKEENKEEKKSESSKRTQKDKNSNEKNLKNSKKQRVS